MEFERLVSSLDAEALSRAAEALLRLLSGGGTAAGTATLPDPAARQGSRRVATLPLSAPEAAGPLPGAPGAGQSGPLAAEILSPSAAVPGGAAAEEAARIGKHRAARSGEGTAEDITQIDTRRGADAARGRRSPEAEAAEDIMRIEARRDTDAARRPRSPGAEAAEEIARLEERLASVPAQNRRTLGAEADTLPPYPSADGPAAADAAAALAVPVSAFSAPRAGGFGAAADSAGADLVTASPVAGAAARDFFDAEAVSEFFRRDSRRYDSGSSDQGEACL